MSILRSLLGFFWSALGFEDCDWDQFWACEILIGKIRAARFNTWTSKEGEIMIRKPIIKYPWGLGSGLVALNHKPFALTKPPIPHRGGRISSEVHAVSGVPGSTFTLLDLV